MNDQTMTMVLVIGVGVLIVGGTIALVIWSIMRERKRTEELSTLANSLSFRFAPTGLFAAQDRYKQISFFQRGRSQRTLNHLAREQDGKQINLFDFRYTMGSGKNQSTHISTVCTIEVAENYPEIYIRPEGFFDKIGAALGFDDIDFEEWREFSKKFCVKSKDKEFVKKFVNKKMTECLLKVGNLYIEICGPALLFHFGRRIKPPEFNKLCAVALEFVNSIEPPRAGLV